MRLALIYPAILITGLLGGCDSARAPKQPQGTLLQGTPEQSKENESLQPYLLEAAATATANHEYGEAASYWGAIYEADPADLNAALQWAINLRYSGNAGDAVNVLNFALQSKPDELRLLAERGKAYAALGTVEPALADISRVAAAMPSDWTVHSTHGIILDRMGKHDEAQNAYRKALALSADNPKILNNLALSTALAGRHDEALEILRRAARLPSAGTHIRQNLSLLLAMKGEIGQAEQLVRADLPNKMAEKNLAYYEGLLEETIP